MCPFELLHFVPLVLIVASLALLKKTSSTLYSSFAIIALSLVGLFSGIHMHTAPEHALPILGFDPCYGYILSLAISSYNFIKNSVKLLRS